MGDLPLFKTKADEEIYSLKSELRSYKSYHGLMQSQIQQLEQEKLESVDAWNSQLEKASAKVKGLEQEVKELNEDLIETQKQATKTESELEEFQSFFVDKDACYELEDKSLSQWLAQHDKELIRKINYLKEQGQKLSVAISESLRFIDSFIDEHQNKEVRLNIGSIDEYLDVKLDEHIDWSELLHALKELSND